MNEQDTFKSSAIVVAGVLLACLIPLIGMDNFLELPQIFLLWFIIGFSETAVGHLSALLLTLITGKNHLRLCLPLCSGIALLFSLLYVEHSSHSFMGRLGSGIINAIFTLPTAVTFFIWLTAALVHLHTVRSHEKDKS